MFLDGGLHRGQRTASTTQTEAVSLGDPPRSLHRPSLENAPSRVTPPRLLEAEAVCHASRRIQPHAHQHVDGGIPASALHPPDEVLVDHIFGKVPSHPDRRRDDKIHGSLELRLHANVAHGGVTDRTQLVEGAVGGTESQSFEPAHPVQLVLETEQLADSLVIVVSQDPDAGRRGRPQAGVSW